MKEIIISIKNFFPIIKDFFELLGVLIITFGSLIAIYHFITDTIQRKHTTQIRFDRFKIALSRFIAAGLELTIVADLINTTIDVTYYSLGILLILVIIRTIIGYFLNKDIENIPVGHRDE